MSNGSSYPYGQSTTQAEIALSPVQSQGVISTFKRPVYVSGSSYEQPVEPVASIMPGMVAQIIRPIQPKPQPKPPPTVWEPTVQDIDRNIRVAKKYLDKVVNSPSLAPEEKRERAKQLEIRIAQEGESKRMLRQYGTANPARLEEIFQFEEKTNVNFRELAAIALVAVLAMKAAR